MRIYKNGELNRDAIFELIKQCLLEEHCRNDTELANCLLNKIQELGLNVKKVFVVGYPVRVQVAGKHITFDAKISREIINALQHNRQLPAEEEEYPF